MVTVPDDLRASAAGRIVGESSPDPLEAGKRFLDAAGRMGIDLSHMRATIDTGAPGVLRQVVLGVIGAGRTAMLFVSGRQRQDRVWMASGGGGVADPAPGAPLAERVACIEALCESLRTPPHHPTLSQGGGGGKGVRLAQALLESREREALTALLVAGFTQLGDLAYMRRPIGSGGLARYRDFAIEPSWPEGLEVVRVVDRIAGGRSTEEVDADLVTALERSYIETLDCPELCGLREAADVLESHRSVGTYDPSLWWLVYEGGRPEGCMLLTFSAEHDGVELVYLGLSPSLRGRGIGGQLLRQGVGRLLAMVAGEVAGPLGPGRSLCAGGLTCAVDSRNTPALRLYRRLGFARFGVRVPLVKSLGGE